MSLRVAFAAVFVLSFACASSRWAATREADTAEAYRAFLRDYPNDENAETARMLLSEKEFEAASAQHTVLAYKRFLEEFPDSPKASAARALLEGLRFNAAQATNTAQAWRLFLSDHPDGAHRAEAERALAEAEFREAGSASSVDALTRLLREHPDDPRRAEIEARLDDQAFEAAEKSGAFAFYDYLRRFPAGAHREQAQAELFGLHIRSLLVSGRVEEARAAVAQSPLAPKVHGLEQAIADAAERQKVLASTDPLVRAAQAGNYLRSIPDLIKSLSAPDPLDRWQAAEELGQYVTADVLDPLIDAFRSARNPLIRQHAFDSIRSVVAALPTDIAQYEIATRLEALRDRASSPETFVVVAALEDAAGDLPAAAAEYQRSWDPNLPDPVILRRWVDIRRARNQHYSAAVAARQLALWAKGVAEASQLPPAGQRIPVPDVRELCAASTYARFALAAIRESQGRTKDFPEDLAQYELQALDASRLADARLKDAELALRTQNPNAHTCDDRRVEDRIAASVKERANALRALSRRGGPAAEVVLMRAREMDPSFEIRQIASAIPQARVDPP
ncbi:MAG: HEAT repeat domain-containing protein [Myxococcaceae bacterium]|nr:HEAT repeat domain-containing protein [Myxococcaceae bacterium]